MITLYVAIIMYGLLLANCISYATGRVMFQFELVATSPIINALKQQLFNGQFVISSTVSNGSITFPFSLTSGQHCPGANMYAWTGMKLYFLDYTSIARI